MSLGNRILKVLYERNLTQKELAKMVGTTEVSIGRYVNDKREPSATMISDIAKALKVSTDYLLGMSESIRNIPNSKTVELEEEFPESMANFQTRLKELRIRENLSQIELSKKLNISNVTLSQYENGVRRPDLNTVSEFADFFNVTTDYLLGRSSKPGAYVNKGSRAFELEEEFPEGVSVLYRANEELTPEQKDIMVRMIKAAFFDDKGNRKKG